jgi:hypothetical protein
MIKSITLRHASPLTLSRRHHIKKGPLHRAGIGYEAAGKGKSTFREEFTREQNP